MPHPTTTARGDFLGHVVRDEDERRGKSSHGRLRIRPRRRGQRNQGAEAGGGNRYVSSIRCGDWADRIRSQIISVMPCHNHASMTCKVPGLKVHQEPVKASTSRRASGYPCLKPSAPLRTRTCRPRPSPLLPQHVLRVVPHRGVGCNPSSRWLHGAPCEAVVRQAYPPS